MIREYYEAVCMGKETRVNLIALRSAIKEEKERRAFAYLLGGDFSVLSRLLEDEDPKVRKNAALLLGEMESEDLLPVLFDRYKKERTLFIRPDYLKAIAGMDCAPYLDEMEQQLLQLRERETLPEEKKHIGAEMRMLQSILLKYRKPKPHVFTGYDLKIPMLLIVNREQTKAIADQIKEGTHTLLKGGIRIKDARIGEILPIRTYSELLFPIHTKQLPADAPEEIGRQLAASELTDLMARLHDGKAPYYFRIEPKGIADIAKKGVWIRKVSDALEQESQASWINSVSNYEAEIRLLMKKDGTMAAFLRLYTIADRRFAYRKESIGSSMNPVNAALCVQLARPWMKENAQVLDPFCGVGTLLIERNRAVAAKTMYGLDIFGDAVEKAKINTARANCRINYIQRDFFTFEHDYLFDEIITDLPQVSGNKAKEEIHRLYFEFFQKAQEHLTEDGVVILYASEPWYAAEAVRRCENFQMEKTFLLNEKNKTTLCIVRYHKKEVK